LGHQEVHGAGVDGADQPLVGAHSRRRSGLYAFLPTRWLACMRRSCNPSGLWAWAACVGDAADPIPSMAAARCNFAPSGVETCWGETPGWLRGKGEVSMCVLLTHCVVRTRAAVGRHCCTHRTSAPHKSSSRAPHRLLASSGGYMGCLGIRCGSLPLSSRGFAISM
jgi:hypothetical protein